MQLISYPLSDEKITEFGSTCVSKNDSSTDQQTLDFTSMSSAHSLYNFV